MARRIDIDWKDREIPREKIKIFDKKLYQEEDIQEQEDEINKWIKENSSRINIINISIGYGGGSDLYMAVLIHYEEEAN